MQQIKAEPFRGCAVIVQDVLYVNFHAYTHHYNGQPREKKGRDGKVKILPPLCMDDFIDQFIQLNTQINNYAQRENKQICLCGDLNLFRLTPSQIERLEAAGFKIDPVKGQEEYFEKLAKKIGFTIYHDEPHHNIMYSVGKDVRQPLAMKDSGIPYLKGENGPGKPLPLSLKLKVWEAAFKAGHIANRCLLTYEAFFDSTAVGNKLSPIQAAAPSPHRSRAS